MDGARLLTLKAAALKDAGKPYTNAAAMAKLFAAETPMKVTTDAVQVHGGYGYIRETEVERYFRRRRQDPPDLRGHLADPEAGDRARGARRA